MKQITTARAGSSSAGNFPAPVFGIVDCLFRIATALETWRLRQQQSMQLARIETRILQDVGISDAQRFIAVHEPFQDGYSPD